jgi:YesN/AraC family two-component response regulator
MYSVTLKFKTDNKANYYWRHFYWVKSHHLNCSVITVVHNAFPKNFRVLSINSSYLVLFRNNRDMSFVHYINRQIYGVHSNFLLECYKRATEKPYDYLVLDFSRSR